MTFGNPPHAAVLEGVRSGGFLAGLSPNIPMKSLLSLGSNWKCPRCRRPESNENSAYNLPSPRKWISHSAASQR